MISLLKNLVILILSLILLLSCKSEPSLQQFIVDHQEKNNVISFDLTPQMLQFQEGMDTPENIEILNSIKKVNVLAYQMDSLQKNVYESEKQQLKNIFKNKKYQEMIRYGKGSNGVKIYTVGNEEVLSEVLLFGNDDSKGWAIVRVSGDKMKPEKIMKLINKVNFQDTDKLKDISNMFNIR